MNSEYTSNHMAVEGRAFEIKRRMGDMIRASFEKVAVNDSVDENIEAILNYTHIYLPEADLELSQELNSLKSEEDKESLIAKTTEIVIRLLATHLSLEELEHRLKSIQSRDFGYEELHRGLTFEVVNDAVHLHVPPTFFSSTHEALGSFTDGLKVLASKLQTDPNLKDVTEILGYSNLVKDKNRLVTKLGFTVTKDEDGQPTHEARISKERFLELYG